MLKIKKFTFNPFSENTYLWINESNECWITDPGMYGASEEKILFDYIASNNLKPVAIINTHAHIDHVLGIEAVKAKYNIPFYMHELDMPVLNNAKSSAMMFGFNFNDTPQPDGFLTHGQQFKMGDDTVEIRLAPGHSPGSVLLYAPEAKLVVGGDVLFAGSVGRTDLPGGDTDTLVNSIKEQMYTLPNDTVVYSGHGPETTIGQEKLTNPFVRG